VVPRAAPDLTAFTHPAISRSHSLLSLRLTSDACPRLGHATLQKLASDYGMPLGPHSIHHRRVDTLVRVYCNAARAAKLRAAASELRRLHGVRLYDNSIKQGSLDAGGPGQLTAVAGKDLAPRPRIAETDALASASATTILVYLSGNTAGRDAVRDYLLSRAIATEAVEPPKEFAVLQLLRRNWYRIRAQLRTTTVDLSWDVVKASRDPRTPILVRGPPAAVEDVVAALQAMVDATKTISIDTAALLGDRLGGLDRSRLREALAYFLSDLTMCAEASDEAATVATKATVVHGGAKKAGGAAAAGAGADAAPDDGDADDGSDGEGDDDEEEDASASNMGFSLTGKDYAITLAHFASEEARGAEVADGVRDFLANLTEACWSTPPTASKRLIDDLTALDWSRRFRTAMDLALATVVKPGAGVAAAGAGAGAAGAGGAGKVGVNVRVQLVGHRTQVEAAVQYLTDSSAAVKMVVEAVSADPAVAYLLRQCSVALGAARAALFSALRDEHRAHGVKATPVPASAPRQHVLRLVGPESRMAAAKAQAKSLIAHFRSTLEEHTLPLTEDAEAYLSTAEGAAGLAFLQDAGVCWMTLRRRAAAVAEAAEDDAEGAEEDAAEAAAEPAAAAPKGALAGVNDVGGVADAGGSTARVEASLVHGITLEVASADLLANTLRVQGLVSSVGPRLPNAAGIARAIAVAGGPRLAAAYDALRLANPGGLRIASVTPLAATGALQAAGLRSILNAVVPDEPTEGSLMVQAVINILDAAHTEGLVSVAIPALGCGVYGWPPADSAACMLQGIRLWAASPAAARSPLRRIVIADTKDAHVDAVCAAVLAAGMASTSQPVRAPVAAAAPLPLAPVLIIRRSSPAPGVGGRGADAGAAMPPAALLTAASVASAAAPAPIAGVVLLGASGAIADAVVRIQALLRAAVVSSAHAISLAGLPGGDAVDTLRKHLVAEGYASVEVIAASGDARVSLRALGAAVLQRAERAALEWCSQRLQAALQAAAAASAVRYPSEWHPVTPEAAQKPGAVFEKVVPGTPEYAFVEGIMTDTLSLPYIDGVAGMQPGPARKPRVWHHSIVSIERVENPVGYQAYFLKCRLIEALDRNKGKWGANEGWLKHGTSTTDPRIICKSEGGLDFRYW
jgi:O-acetyl-ADP-ribose deacetylase (regulator of RNase III)